MTDLKPQFDVEAVAIGKLYASSKARMIDAVLERVECGKRLAKKKAERDRCIGGGMWLRWLQENYAALGFKERAAQRMIKAAQEHASLTTHATEAEALAVNRHMWGNDKKRPPRKEDAKPRLVRNAEEAKRVAHARRAYDANEGSTPYMLVWDAFAKLSRDDQEKLIEQGRKYLLKKRKAPTGASSEGLKSVTTVRREQLDERT